MKINLTKEPISKTTVYEASHKDYQIVLVHEQIEDQISLNASFHYEDDDEYAKENYT